MPNPFAFLVVTLFIFAFLFEACQHHWTLATFYLLSALINITVRLL